MILPRLIVDGEGSIVDGKLVLRYLLSTICHPPSKQHHVAPHGVVRAKHPIWDWSFLLALFLIVAGCQQDDPKETYVARVGDAYLSQETLHETLASLPSRQDSSEARQQLVDQWVVNELLYQEALRLNVRNDPEVQQRLEESERAVLIDALVTRLYDEELEKAITPAAIRSYYDLHQEQLRLLEPFVQVRYLIIMHPDTARVARQIMQQSTFQAAADSLWPSLVERFAEDPEGSLTLSGNYYPQSRLFMDTPALHQQLVSLQPGQTAPVLTRNGKSHLLQLANRVPAGTIPKLSWIEEEVRRLLTIDARKQMYERQVQRLRTEAQSRAALDIR